MTDTLLYCEFFFEARAEAYEAFKNIGRGPDVFDDHRPYRIKLMGTGAGSGFSIWPDFKRYALLFFFRNPPLAEAFYRENPLLGWYREKASSSLTATLKPIKAHGSWAGEKPFGEISAAQSLEGPIAVITRATIRPRRLLEFWANVPRVAKFMKSTTALHQVGIGEYPLFMQATFSIWRSPEALQEAAYKRTPHAEIVKKTRERNWYKEELFAEFAIAEIRVSGKAYPELEAFTSPRNPGSPN